jgi:hypothetical protein
MSKFWFWMKDDRGAITAMTAIMLAAFLGLLALIIDLGHLQTVKNELQNAADDCALAGARAFVTYTQPWIFQPDAEILGPQKASNSISDNRSDVGGKALAPLINLPLSDVVAGSWQPVDHPDQPFQPWIDWNNQAEANNYLGKTVGPAIGGPAANQYELIVQKSPSYNTGPVAMSLANLFGIQTVDVKAGAIAWLAPGGGPDEGTMNLPFGTWLSNIGTDPGQYSPDTNPLIEGTFAPNPNNTLGWSDLTKIGTQGTKPSANTMKKIIDGTYQPVCPTGTTVGIQNGTDASVIQEFYKSENNRFGLQPATDDSGGYVPSNDPNPDPAVQEAQPGATYADTIYWMPIYYDGSNYPQYNQNAVVAMIPVNLVEIWGPPTNQINVKLVDKVVISPNLFPGQIFMNSFSTTPQLVQ